MTRATIVARRERHGSQKMALTAATCIYIMPTHKVYTHTPTITHRTKNITQDHFVNQLTTALDYFRFLS